MKKKSWIIKNTIHRNYWYRTEFCEPLNLYLSIVGDPPNEEGLILTIWMSPTYNSADKAEIAAISFIEGMICGEPKND